jgi:hypothetical protein
LSLAIIAFLNEDLAVCTALWAILEIAGCC